MFGRKKKPVERVPWYREKKYKGNMTEKEKRQLDSFRMQERHPADHDLPEEVERYISNLEMEVYDNKQQALALCVLLSTGIAGYFLVRYLLGYEEASPLNYSVVIAFIVFPWIYYKWRFNKNAEEFLLRWI